MGWSEKYKKLIDCNNPKGFSQRAHCQESKKEDEKSFTSFTHKTPHLKKLQHQLDPNLDLKQLVHHATVQYVDRDADGDVDVYDKPSKKTPDENVSSAVKASEYSKKLIAKQKGELKHTRRGMAYENLVKEGLRDWYGDSKSKGGKPGWVNVVTGGTCASDEPGEGVPKCVSSEKRESMTKGERLSASRRKKAADKNQQSKSGAAKPTYVSTDSSKKEMNEESDVKGKGSGTKDACYTKVKSRYSVWPSAYASGALVKCRKVGAANWGNKSESINLSSKDSISEEMGMRYCPKCEKDETRDVCKYGPKYWDMFSLPSKLSPNQMKFSIAQVHPANESKEPDHEYSMARSELSTIISAAKRLRGKLNGEGNIEAWVQSKITKAADYIDAAADYLDSGEHEVKEACWKGYKQVGMKKKGKKMVPNCVEESVSIEDANGNPYVEFIDIMKPEKIKTFNQFVTEAKKSEMKCNSPKSDPVGDSLTGKSHVVKACEGGKEKLLRFGQRGVKGSPKKKGESKEYASRRNRFQTRHAKNIAKGKMSAAFWSNKVKW
jgi:hypothetical protein